MIICATHDYSEYIPEPYVEYELAAVEIVDEPEPEDSYLPKMAHRIADCESGEITASGRAIENSYRLTVKNPNSSASGKYQAINSTWEWVMNLPAPASAYPEHVQDEFFVRLWNNGKGASHWNPSRHCWAEWYSKLGGS